jgi:hypothetical protein
MVPGDEGARPLFAFVQAGNVELQDHVAAQLVVLPGNDPRPADIVQPACDFEQTPLRGSVSMERAKTIEKGEGQGRNLFAVRRVGIIGFRGFMDEGYRRVRPLQPHPAGLLSVPSV